MFQSIVAAVLASLVKAVFGRWLTPKEKPDATIVAEKAEAKALASPPDSERAVDERLRHLQRLD